ncbi:Hsp70 family protein [Streptomyces sp. NPDC058611]|uniref:Hsp70 family protein n=1 Tax=unclassified Streptomyces TaxID=2593676 RepID=UPI003651E708
MHTEPAAAVYALHDHGMGRERTVLVYDLGGGTFDLAIARGTRDSFTVLGSPGGLPHVGGLAIDQAVLGLIRDRCPAAALDSLRSLQPPTPCARCGRGATALPARGRRRSGSGGTRRPVRRTSRRPSRWSARTCLRPRSGAAHSRAACPHPY